MIDYLRFVLLLTSASVANAGLGRLPQGSSGICMPWVDHDSPDGRLSADLWFWRPRVRLEMVLMEPLWVHPKADDRKAGSGPEADLTAVSEFVQIFLKLYPLEKYP